MRSKRRSTRSKKNTNADHFSLIEKHIRERNGEKAMAKHFFDHLFSKEAINTGRQIEFDIGKAIVIFYFPFVHCIIECCTDKQLMTGIPYLLDSVLGGPLGAPMFMFCMGATVHFSRSNAPADLARRGLKLLLVGFILNICRFLIPDLIGWAITGNAEQFLVPLPFGLFGDDILQFAGLAFLCFALFKKLNTPKWLMLAIALVLSVGGTLLGDVDLGFDALNIAGGWLLPTVNAAGLVKSDFPLLNWLIVPVCGYLFGDLIRRVKEKKRFYLCFSPALLVFTAVYFFFGIRNKIGMFGFGENCYYHLSTSDAAVCLASTLGVLGLLAAAAYILPPAVRRFFIYVSKSITTVYCVHWVLVRLIVNVGVFVATGSLLLPVWVVLLISLGIFVLMFLIPDLYRRLFPHEREKK